MGFVFSMFEDHYCGVNKDDVYNLEENYLQCFCSPTGEGIQTFWERSETGIHGLQWNLGDYYYTAVNTNYSCLQPSPSPEVLQPGDQGLGDEQDCETSVHRCDGYYQPPVSPEVKPVKLNPAVVEPVTELKRFPSTGYSIF